MPAPMQEGTPIRNTEQPGAGQTCCRSGPSCERAAAAYIFFDTRCPTSAASLLRHLLLVPGRMHATIRVGMHDKPLLERLLMS